MKSRYTEAQRQAFRTQGVWADRTIADDARRWVETDPDALVFLAEPAPVTYGSLFSDAMKLGRALASAGMRQGDVVSFMIPNWVEAAVINLAACLMGFVINPIVPIYRAAETRAILADCRSRAIFIPTSFRNFDYIAMLRALKPALPALAHIITVRGAVDDMDSYAQMLDRGDGLHEAGAIVAPDSIKMVMYTSGTTGRPKAVLHDHNTLARSLRASAAYWGTQAGDVFLMPSPVTHVSGFCNGLERPFIEGTRTLLMESWNADTAVALTDRYGANATVAATPFLAEMIDAAARAGSKLPSFRIFACGGAAVPRALIRAANATFAQSCACRVYGSSEAPFISLGFIGDQAGTRAAETDGYVYDYEVIVVDDSGRRLDTSEDGEILVRGPALFVGYSQEEQNREAFDAEGFFRTGDIGHIDADGAITLTGRKKDLIIRGGENISAKEIEDVLHGHPRILEAAVVAMPHARLGEGICAFLVLRETTDTSPLVLDQLLAGSGLARQKFPERVEILGELPKTASGKVRKDQLRALVAASAEKGG